MDRRSTAVRRSLSRERAASPKIRELLAEYIQNCLGDKLINLKRLMCQIEYLGIDLDSQGTPMFRFNVILKINNRRLNEEVFIDRDEFWALSHGQISQLANVISDGIIDQIKEE